MARSPTRTPARAVRPVALITGAAKGIGRAIALHLLEAGWCVTAFDLPKTRLAQQFRGWARSSVTYEGDAADEDAVREAVALTLERFGRLDAVAEALEGLGRASPFGLEQPPSFGRGG